LTEIALSLLAAIAAIVLHEVAHGYAALALGDTTAQRLGRLTLNPIAHVDRVGTLIVPGVLLVFQYLFGGHFMFGWAKPVPVDPSRFRDPRRGMMLVAAAGPAINFALAWLTALALNLAPDPDTALGGTLIDFAIPFILFNLVLGLFNLLPIPPLDGGRIIVGLLPLSLAILWARLERFGILIVLGLLVLLPMLLRDLGLPYDPVMGTLQRVLLWALALLPFPEGLAGGV
jgi:Zn-dependent protease